VLIVIVGAGLAGLRTAAELRRLGCDSQLVLVGDERHLPYSRPPLSKEVLRGDRDNTTLEPAEYYQNAGIELRLGSAATALDPRTRTVRLADGTRMAYDKAVIATGLRARHISGLPNIGGVHTLRSKDDAARLRADVRDARRVVVVGAGFIGCEVAASLRQRELDVILVEPQSAPLEAVLGRGVGNLVARLHRSEGVDLRTGIGIVSLLGRERVSGIALTDGSEVAADVVVVGVGSLPTTDWLDGSGIDIANGVLADEVGRTSVRDVWTIGDVSAWRVGGSHRRVEHWTNVADQARVLAAAMVGVELHGAGPVPYFWSDQFDIKIQALGTPSGDDTVQIVADDGRRFLANYFRDGVLVGVVGGGMAGAVARARQNIGRPAPTASVRSQVSPDPVG
jgi:3-phenylpropionate/trans-cinnamate dioxygenase ferredoxin reductase subunit